MPLLSTVSVACAALWLALVVTAQLLAPELSPLSMGMSGLATGRHGWAMKAAFVARALSACALAAALPGALYPGWRLTAGFVLLWVWGVGSVLLALFDTDMPGDRPTRHGQAHVLIAFVAYVAVAAGAVVLSPAVLSAAGGGLARLALPVALAAIVFLVLQFAGFGQAARAAAAGDAAAGAVGDGAVGDGAAGEAGEGAGVPPPRARGLGAYAGLLQRLFVGLVMVWIVLVALTF